MSIGKRIISAREEKKLDRGDLADLCGFGYSRISNYENDIREPSANDVSVIARVLGKRAGWIMFGEGEQNENFSTLLKIPQISWNQLKLLNNGKLELKSEDKEMFPGIHEGCFTLTVKDDQMSAPVGSKFTYPEGTIIIVDPTKEYKSGDCVIVRLKNSDDYFFKQYIYDTGKHLFKSLNPNYNVTIEMTDDMEIMGVVVGGYQPSRDFR
jgi:SOS-response transcriptional repressor LexA